MATPVFYGKSIRRFMVSSATSGRRRFSSRRPRVIVYHQADGARCRVFSLSRLHTIHITTDYIDNKPTKCRSHIIIMGQFIISDAASTNLDLLFYRISEKEGQREKVCKSSPRRILFVTNTLTTFYLI